MKGVNMKKLAIKIILLLTTCSAMAGSRLDLSPDSNNNPTNRAGKIEHIDTQAGFVVINDTIYHYSINNTIVFAKRDSKRQLPLESLKKGVNIEFQHEGSGDDQRLLQVWLLPKNWNPDAHNKE